MRGHVAGVLATLLEVSARWLRGAAPEMDCDLCRCPTGEVVHHVVLCRSCNPGWRDMKRRMLGWERL